MCSYLGIIEFVFGHITSAICLKRFSLPRYFTWRNQSEITVETVCNLAPCTENLSIWVAGRMKKGKSLSRHGFNAFKKPT